MRIALVTTSWPAHEGDPSGHFVRAEARELERAGARGDRSSPRRRGAPSAGRASRRACASGRGGSSTRRGGWWRRARRLAALEPSGSWRTGRCRARGRWRRRRAARARGRLARRGRAPAAARMPRLARERIVAGPRARGGDVALRVRAPARTPCSTRSSPRRARRGRARSPPWRRRRWTCPTCATRWRGRGAPSASARVAVSVGRLVREQAGRPRDRARGPDRASSTRSSSSATARSADGSRRSPGARGVDARFVGVVPREEALAWIGAAAVVLSPRSRRGEHGPARGRRDGDPGRRPLGCVTCACSIRRGARASSSARWASSSAPCPSPSPSAGTRASTTTSRVSGCSAAPSPTATRSTTGCPASTCSTRACVALFGEHMWGIRVAEVLCVVALGLACAYAATARARRPAPGVRGASVFAACTLYWAFFDFWNTAQCELWASRWSWSRLPSCSGRRGERLAAIASGFLGGLAMLLKPTVLPESSSSAWARGSSFARETAGGRSSVGSACSRPPSWPPSRRRSRTSRRRAGCNRCSTSSCA